MLSLPDFLTKAIEEKNTSLGDNGIFGGNAVSLAYSLLKKRNEQVIESVLDRLGYMPTIDEAKSKLSKLISKAIEIEKPLKNQLEKLCEAVVNTTLGVPQETILLNCELVDKIEPYRSLRIMPEYDSTPPNTLNFNYSDEILKRRAVNSIVQGISYLLMMATYDSEQLNEWSDDLAKIYGDIIALNDFLLFSEEEQISDKTPMLGAYVETDIGKSGEKTVINSQGLIYPFLLQETYRGFFEAFATHGLPDNIEDAMYIIKRADFTIAEAWDLRIGVAIWQEIDKTLNDDIDPTIYPYLFSSIVEFDCDEFNKLVNDILLGSDKPKDLFKSMIQHINHDKEYQLFKNDIERFNLEKCLVTDENNKEDNIIN